MRKVSDDLEGNPLTFIDNEKFIDDFTEKHELFSCVITTESIGKKICFFVGGMALCDYPKVSFIEINNRLPTVKLEQMKTVIGHNSLVSKNSHVSEFGVVIGDNVVIEDNVRIYSGVEIGDNVIIKYGTLIGCEDYERCWDKDNHLVSAKHKGIVKIRDNVQIDEYVIVDRPLFDWDITEIGQYSFIGKKTYISHGTKIGSSVFVAPCVTICGNTTIEDNARIGVGAIIGSRIVIGVDSTISIGSVVNQSVPSNQRVTGNLAIPHDRFMEHLKGMVKQDF